MTSPQTRESQIEVSYTAVEMQDREPASESRLNPIQVILSALQRDWRGNGRVKFIITAVGIILSYVCFGIMQEKIMKGCYGDDINKDCRDGVKFKYAASLVAVQFVCAYIFMKALSILKPEREDSTHYGYYACGAVLNSLAMVSSNSALKYVTFPLQVILKSAKPISVMVTGLLFCKRYPIQRYFFVVLIVVGVVVFKLYESKEGKVQKSDKQEAEKDDYSQLYGIFLLLLSLVMDGLLGAVQDRIKEVHSPTPRQMMLAMSGWALLLITSYVFATGEIVDVTAFVRKYPQLVWYLSIYSLCGVIGQTFIFTMIASFGSLPCSITTTVRKFLSVVFSIVFFGHPSTLIQWIGAILVFSGLLADTFFGKKKRCNEADAETAQNTEEPPNVSEKPDPKSEADIKIAETASNNGHHPC